MNTDGSAFPESMHQEVRAEAGFAYGAVGADIHVFGDGTPVYLLFVRRTRQRQDPEWLRAQPSRMLDARAELVEFTGREAEMAELGGWRDAPARMAVRWLHGPAGQGKTRLAARLAAESARDGWLVVEAVHGTETHAPAEGSQDLRTTGRSGVLLLVDYADRWPVTHLSWLMHNSLFRADIPVRILMVARSVHAWPAVRAKLHRLSTGVQTSDQQLAGLSARSALERRGEREAMFDVARRCFEAQYPTAGTPRTVEPPALLGGAEFGLTLAVHMAALVSVDARIRNVRAPGDLLGMTTYLLDRERENWRQLYENREHGLPHATPDTELARAVFIAALTGPLSRQDAARLLGRLPLRVPGARLVADHARCYPPTDPGGDHRLEPLLPDRLAEDFLALSLPGSPVTGHPTDLWTVSAATQALRRFGDAAPPYTARALSFLAGAAERWPHVGDRLLFPLLRRDPQLAVDAGSGVLSALAAIETLDPEVLEAVESSLPSAPDVRVDEGAGELAGRLTEQRMAAADGLIERSMLSLELSVQHSRAGRQAEAVTAAEEAVALAREAAQEPGAPVDKLPAVLAGALVNLAHFQARTGRAADAEAALTEAIDLLRRQQPGTDGHRLLLGEALAGLGVAMHRMGRAADAVASFEEAIAVHESRADDEDLFHEYEIHVQLMPTWVDYSSALKDVGRHDEAIDYLRATVENIRGRARVDAGRYGPLLAGATFNLGVHLWDGGRREEAVAASRNTVGLYRSLAEVRPRFRRELADSLLRFGVWLGETGRSQEAILALEESVGLYRALLDTDRSHLDMLTTASYHLRMQRRAERNAWGRPEEIDKAAKELARAGDWPALWWLVRAAPVADAVRIARRLPRRNWSPPGGEARALVRRLHAQEPRAVERTVAAAGEMAVWRSDFVFAAPFQVSFAPNSRPFMSRITVEPDSRGELIEIVDLEGRTPTAIVYRGARRHSLVQCLGPYDALAVRERRIQGVTESELVHYSRGSEQLVARGTVLEGACAAATTRSWVLGLRLAHGALVASVGGPLREVDLRPHGLRRGDTLTVDPSGTRLAFADASGFVVMDADASHVIAQSRLPPKHGELIDIAFVSPEELITSGSGGGLHLWQLEGGAGCLVCSAEDTPRLVDLFAVPAWRVVGGWAHGKGRAYFFDMVTLDPAPVPRPMVADHVQAIVASPDGRYVVYGGQLDVGAPRRRRSFALTSALHDLRHPGALLQRPPISLTGAELELLDSTTSDAASLLELMRDMTALPPDESG